MRGYFQEIFNMSSGVKSFIITETLLGIALGLYTMVYNLHLIDLGLTEANIGEIVSSGTLVMGIMSIPSVIIANRIGRKKLLILGMSLMAIGYLSIGLGTQYVVFYFAQITVSIGITFLVSSEIQLLFYYAKTKREEILSYNLLFSIYILFTSFGTILGGFLPEWVGGDTTIYQSSMLLSAIIMFLAAFIRGFTLPKEQIIFSKDTNLIKIKKVQEQLLNKSMWIFVSFLFLIGMGFNFINPYLNVIVQSRFEWGNGLISLFLTIHGLFLFIAAFFLPIILKKIGVKWTYNIIFINTILFSFLLFFIVPVSSFIIIFLVRGGSFTILSNLIESQSMQSMREEERNLFAGMRTVTRSIGSAISAYIAGIILTLNNYQLPFLLSALTFVLAYIFYKKFIYPLFLSKGIIENKESEKVVLQNN